MVLINKRINAVVVITHYQRLLDYTPDFVHVLLNGKIVKIGDAALALELEKRIRLIKQEQEA
jgi:Fe-S cluster assembly ATP-binding protein